jgi:hypothetical protein
VRSARKFTMWVEGAESRTAMKRPGDQDQGAEAGGEEVEGSDYD